MENANLETLKEDLESTLRYWYETISEYLFVENLDQRSRSLEEMKSLVLAIKTIRNENFNPKNLKTIHIKTRAKLDIILKYNNQEDIYNLAFKG